jgi:hypothetical protein
MALLINIIGIECLDGEQGGLKDSGFDVQYRHGS